MAGTHASLKGAAFGWQMIVASWIALGSYHDALAETERAGAQAQADSTASESAVSDITAADIGRWVRDLGANEFATRDLATQHLIAAGPAALEPVAQALAGSGLEVTTRVIYVLQQLAAHGNTAVEDDARQVLTRLASQRTTLAARRAAESLALLNVLRQDKSLVALQKLGAIVNRNYGEPGVTLEGSTFLVEINSEWQGSVQDLAYLRWLADVQQVTFSGKQVNDAWLPILKEMRRLMVVKLVSASTTDAGLAALKGSPVRKLLLQYMPVSDEVVEHLSEITFLDHVRAFGTQMSEDGEKALAKRGINVDRRNGAFLGVTVQRTQVQDEENWAIDRVTKGSAAEKADLKPGDVVVRYADLPVATFTELTKLIGKNSVGDTVAITVRRQNQFLEKQITFGQWK